MNLDFRDITIMVLVVTVIWALSRRLCAEHPLPDAAVRDVPATETTAADEAFTTLHEVGRQQKGAA